MGRSSSSMPEIIAGGEGQMRNSGSVRRKELISSGTANVVIAWTVNVFGVLLVLGRFEPAVSMNTDPWEIWSTRPDGSMPKQDLLLMQGRLRHSVIRNDLEAFKRTLAAYGCSPEAAPEATCEPFLHHLDENGRSIYHLIGQKGYGGDYVQHKHIPGEKYDTEFHNVTEPWYFSVQMAIKQQRLDPDSWRTQMGSASIPESNDVMSDSLLYKIYHYSMDDLKIQPKLKLRDVSGQTPLHEAALHGHVLTLRAFYILRREEKDIFAPDPTVPYDMDYVRAKPLTREWGFGWTMMNFAAISARLSGLRSNVQAAMKTAMESQQNFDMTKGMTIMDYAAINGHASVIDYLGRLETSGESGIPGLTGLGFAPSNWLEKPVQKAVTMGHTDAVETFITHYGCTKVMSVQSLGGENILHNAVGGGHADILRVLQDNCDPEYRASLADRAAGGLVRYFWSEQTPCAFSQVMIEFINTALFGDGSLENGPEFPEDFPGNHRARCSHDAKILCTSDFDCQSLVRDEAKENVKCDLSIGGVIDAYDLMHHFDTCRLVCTNAFSAGSMVNVDRVCGPEITDDLRTWIVGEPNLAVNPYGPKDPTKGPPKDWADYRRDPFDWYSKKEAAEAA